MFEWNWVWVVLLLVAAGLVAYLVMARALIDYVQRDMRRRGAPDWLGWAFVVSTPLGLIVWLIARRFFKVKDKSDQ